MASGEKAIKTAFLVNLGIFAIKLIAALVTRSAGMLAEAVHSMADTGNQVLLFVGLKRSVKPADDKHPFGYGKETYFWSFLVAMFLFMLGSVYSIYEGVHKLEHLEPLQHAYINFIILGISVALEGYSWYVAKQALGECSLTQMVTEVVHSKDANTVVVFVEDTAALMGLAIALLGNVLAVATGNPLYDAAASLVIGVLLFFMAGFIINEMRKFIIGEHIDADELRQVKELVSVHRQVKAMGSIKSMQLGTNSCLLVIEIDFHDHLRDKELEAVMTEIRGNIKNALPKADHVVLQLIGGR